MEKVPEIYKTMYQEVYGLWEKEYFLLYGVYPQIDTKQQRDSLLDLPNVRQRVEPRKHKNRRKD